MIMILSNVQLYSKSLFSVIYLESISVPLTIFQGVGDCAVEAVVRVGGLGCVDHSVREILWNADVH